MPLQFHTVLLPANRIRVLLRSISILKAIERERSPSSRAFVVLIGRARERRRERENCFRRRGWKEKKKMSSSFSCYSSSPSPCAHLPCTYDDEMPLSRAIRRRRNRRRKHDSWAWRNSSHTSMYEHSYTDFPPAPAPNLGRAP